MSSTVDLDPGRNTPTRLDAYHRQNENNPGYDWMDWTLPDKAGCTRRHVIQLFRMRCYSARCGCGALIVMRRYLPRRSPELGLGPWQVYCDDCRQANERAHNAGAKERMSELRAERSAFKADQFQKLAERNEQAQHRYPVSPAPALAASPDRSFDTKCEHCREWFPSTRSDARYCTPRCRTAACRDRKKHGTPWERALAEFKRRNR